MLMRQIRMAIPWGKNIQTPYFPDIYGLTLDLA
jgi:hypothetical protein